LKYQSLLEETKDKLLYADEENNPIYEEKDPSS
jgi:hypothetical protein